MADREVQECCGKITDRSEAERKKLIHRLNRIEGQIRGIRKWWKRMPTVRIF